MAAFSAELADSCAGGAAVIFLYGPLGVGKTTFTRGFLRALGYEGLVKSPTYTLVEVYDLKKRTICHFDFYRVKDPDELEAMGIRDYFTPDAVCLIEWPEYGEKALPKADISCHFTFHDKGRVVKLVSHSASGDTILRRFQYDK